MKNADEKIFAQFLFSVQFAFLVQFPFKEHVLNLTSDSSCVRKLLSPRLDCQCSSSVV